MGEDDTAQLCEFYIFITCVIKTTTTNKQIFEIRLHGVWTIISWTLLKAKRPIPRRDISTNPSPEKSSSINIAWTLGNRGQSV